MYTSIISTLQNFIVEFPQMEINRHRELCAYEVTNEFGRILNGFRAFVKENENTIEAAEMEFYRLFKDKIGFELKFYQGRYNTMFKGVDIAERLKKVVWSLSEHAKRLGIYEPPAPVPKPKPATKKAESAPAVVDGAVNGESKKLSERDKKILESIKTIEAMLTDLKSLIYGNGIA